MESSEGGRVSRATSDFPRHHFLMSSQFSAAHEAVVQWLSVGLVIERSLVRLPAAALSSQLGQLSLPSLSGVGKSSTGLYGWG